MGYQALSQNVSGINNTIIGSSAGLTSTNGNNNIALGAGANLPITTGSNQMNIGNAIFGTNMNGTLASPAGEIGIGTSSP